MRSTRPLARCPSRAQAGQLYEQWVADYARSTDANDFLYWFESSYDYDPSADMEKIETTLLAINAADDERNPPETGLTAGAIRRIRNGRLYLIPASTETRGHLTTGNAKFYAEQLRDLLQTAPQKTM